MALQVQAKAGAWAAATLAATTTLNSPPGAGNTLIALLVEAEGSNGTGAGMGAAGWTLLQRKAARSSQATISLYARPLAAGDPSAWSSAAGGSYLRVVHLLEVAGAVDVSAGTSNGSAYVSTFTGATLEPSSAGGAGLVVAGFAAFYQSYNVGNLSPVAPLAELAEVYSGGRCKAWLGSAEVDPKAASYDPAISSTVVPASNDAANTWGYVGAILVPSGRPALIGEPGGGVW